MPVDKKLIEDLRSRKATLDLEYERLRPTYQKLARLFLSLRRKLLDKNCKDVYRYLGDIDPKVLDKVGVDAVNIAAAGMQGGLTSPSKPWFKLGLEDSRLERLPQVATFLDEARRVMLDVLSRSNFYNAIHADYKEILVFGTSVLMMLDDDEEILNFIALNTGEYVCSSNHKNQIDTLFRTFLMSARQLVEQFGEENVSRSVLDSFKNASTKDASFKVIHAVYPNIDYDPTKEDVDSMKFRSVYFEEQNAEEGKILSLGGFRENVFAAARWALITSVAAYGASPAMDVLDSAFRLQGVVKTVEEAMQKYSDPPMNIPADAGDLSLDPGAENAVSSPDLVATPTITVQPYPDRAMGYVAEIRGTIRRGLFNDLFKTLEVTGNSRMTALETQERVAEGLRLLGPSLNRLEKEKLAVIIDRVFSVCLRRGLFPEPPPELLGREITVEYVSTLAQAQKAFELGVLSQFINALGAIAGLNPQALDTVDFDKIAVQYGQFAGVPPSVLRSDEEVRGIREARAQAQLDQVRMESAEAAARTAKDVAQAEAGG